MKNTGDEDLNMYIINELVPADFKPGSKVLVRDENIQPVRGTDRSLGSYREEYLHPRRWIGDAEADHHRGAGSDDRSRTPTSTPALGRLSFSISRQQEDRPPSTLNRDDSLSRPVVSLSYRRYRVLIHPFLLFVRLFPLPQHEVTFGQNDMRFSNGFGVVAVTAQSKIRRFNRFLRSYLPARVAWLVPAGRGHSEEREPESHRESVFSWSVSA